MEVQVAPVLGHQCELEPERPGLRAAMEDYEEEHHEKKPMLTKVKEKVKKIKNTIKKKHGHGEHQEHQVVDDDSEDEESIEDEPEVHGGTSIVAHDARATSGDPVGGWGTSDVEAKTQLKDLLGGFKEDPAAPLSDSSKTEAIRGGEEIGTFPVIQSFGAMALRAEREDEKPTEEGMKGNGGGDGSSYGEKLSATAKMAYEKVADAGAIVVEEVLQPGTTAAKTAYEKAVEKVAQPAGATVAAEGGGRVRMRLAEKLKPGEGDKALSEVISDAIGRRKAAAEEKMVQVTVFGVKGGGVGVIERLKGAATSWVGGRGGRDSGAVASPSSEQERKEMEDLKGRDESEEEIQKEQRSNQEE